MRRIFLNGQINCDAALEFEEDNLTVFFKLGEIPNDQFKAAEKIIPLLKEKEIGPSVNLDVQKSAFYKYNGRRTKENEEKKLEILSDFGFFSPDCKIWFTGDCYKVSDGQAYYTIRHDGGRWRIVEYEYSRDN